MPTNSFYYREKARGSGDRQIFASHVGEVIFDDVQDVSKFVEVASNGRTINSPALDVLGLKGPVGKTFRGDVGLALSDGVSRDGAHIYSPNKWGLHGRGCVAARPV